MSRIIAVCISLGVVLVSGCGSSVSSSEDAKKAYLGLDPSIDKAITLGFNGFNTANSANIAPQMVAGGKTGTLTVNGQVDQGSSSNKGMRLNETFANYSEDGNVTYASNAQALPQLVMQLKNIPTGTLSGTLVGTVTMTGEEKGDLKFDLAFTGTLQAGPGMTVLRQVGNTHVTGTATSSAGTFVVDLMK